MAAFFLTVLGGLGLFAYLQLRRGAVIVAPAAPEPFVRLGWTKASVVLSGAPDPYNKAYADFVAARERKGRDLNQIGDGAGGAVVALAGTVLATVAATGFGAVLVAVYELANLIGQYVVPPSEGGWEKLQPLQRQRAILYQLHKDFEPERNKRPYPSQFIDLTVPDLGARQVAAGPSVPGLPPQSTGTQPAQIHDERYPLHVRNQIIRRAYENHFNRVVGTADEPMLPTVLVNALLKAGLWPPPLPPARPDYFGPPAGGPDWKFRAATLGPAIPMETDFDRQVYEVQYRQLVIAYEADAAKFAELAGLADIRPDTLADAAATGCVPDLASDPIMLGELRKQNARTQTT